MREFAGVCLLLSVFLLGCVEQTTYATNDESDKVAKHILDKAPRMQKRVGADLDGKIVLLGYDLSAKKVEPGGSFEVTWYWECKESLGPGWQLFTHVLNSSGKSKINKDKVGPVRKHFQPEYWRPGLIIKDVQKVKIPSSWGSPTVDLRVGLWKGSDRLKVVSGPGDKENRIKGPVLAVGELEADPTEIPWAASAPVIDGKFEDEDAWKGALKLDGFFHTLKGEPAKRPTDVRIMWDKENLYVAMKATDDYIQSKYENHDDELWKEDAFEIFLDPGGDKKHYYEIQVSPAGVVFDSYLPRYRKNTNEWSSNVVAKVTLDGTLNDDEAGDKGWTAELALPLSSLDKGGHVPPTGKDLWKINFFRVDITENKPRYSAWSPPLRGDFHALDRFAEVVFQGSPAAQAAPNDGDAGVSSADGGVKAAVQAADDSKKEKAK